MSIATRHLGTTWMRNGSAGIALALALAGAAAGQHPNHPLGFDAARAYQDLSGIDTVDLFSGTLSLHIPIGPFSLTYNSNVWRYETVLEKDIERIHAMSDNRQTAGFGWHLGLGEVYHSSHPYNTTGAWLYVDEGGGQHIFYQKMHKGEDDDDSSLLYTRDGSYLRLKKWNHFFVDIHFPDGSIARFDSGTGGLQTTYQLSKSWGAVASEADPEATVPDLTVTYGIDPADPGKRSDTLRTVTDRFGRQHRIHLSPDLPFMVRTVTRVDVQGVAGQRLLYDFTYDAIHVNRSCKDDYAASSDRLVLPHLVRIDLPDGKSYRMKDDTGRFYFNLCLNHAGQRVDDVAGVMSGIDLPTGGKMRWEFQEYEFPPGEGVSPFNTSAGVASRSLLETDGTPLAGTATWTYKTSRVNPGAGLDPEIHTEVVNPTGDCSKHFFDARYSIDVQSWRGWEYGLPFVYSQESGGRYLSSQVFDSSDPATGSCAGTLHRSFYLAFRFDVPPGTNCSGPPDDCPRRDWYNLNRQVQATRVVYDQDGGRWADTEYADFDGVGHFRRMVTTGNFWPGSASNERREVVISYNRTSGSYPGGGYVPPAPADPWVLGVHDSVEVTELDAVGASTARVELGFEVDTGFMLCRRTLASGTTRSAADLLLTQTRDALGLPVDIKRYGGDLQPLPVGGAGCGTVPATPAYWERHGYDYGVLSSTRPIDPASGLPGAFLTYDADIDASSGALLRRRDPSGFEVAFGYDAADRLESIVPAEGAQARFTYLPPTAAGGPRLGIAEWTADGLVQMTAREHVFDGFGRLRFERRQLPGGIWSERETVRNARGWVTATSQWGDLGKRVERLEFDPFGRPGRIRPPGGSVLDVKLTYWGDRQTRREERVWRWNPETESAGLTYVPHIEVLDRHRRLRKVLERSGPAGPEEQVPTTYRYDVGGRLTEITSGTSPAQVRSFTFDNRGFLLAESHPEKGVTGGGTIAYDDHDAGGRAHRRVDGPHDLAMAYDFMGRLTSVRELSAGKRLLHEVDYDAAAGRGMGKPWRVDRTNWVDLPWNAAGVEGVNVRQTYRYEGLQGAVSRKETRFIGWDLGTMTFAQDYAHDELGNVTVLHYPRCLMAACTGAAADGRQVISSFDQGLLIGVTGWADAVAYYPSGQWSELHHANGVIDHLTPDANYTLRIRRSHTSGVQPPASADFDTGNLLYDGAGNLRSMGAATFAYDKVSRLAHADYGGGLLRQYGYDAFGNLTSIVRDGTQTVTFGVDAATNRLSAGSYDGAGNLIGWAGVGYTYDPTQRLVGQAGEIYLYDAAGERTATLRQGVGLVPTPPKVTFHLRSLDQRVLSRLELELSSMPTGFAAGGWSRDRDYIYGGGRLLGSAVFTGIEEEQHHVHLDHLRSPRLITRADGTVHASHTFMPYGEELGTSADDDPIRFGGHERDAAAGTDYLHARHYHPGLARFMSVDPRRGDAAAPQSLNRYAFVTGNPLTLIDPTGMNPQSTEDDRNVDNTSTGNGDGDLELEFFATITVVGQAPRFIFYPGRYGPTGVDLDPSGGGVADRDRHSGQEPPAEDSPPFPRDENGRRDCSNHPNPVLCETTNVNRDQITSDFDCGLLAFAGASVLGGIELAGAGPIRGLFEGVRAGAIGFQSLVRNFGGMAGLANWTFAGTQNGFFGAMVARGSVGAFPMVLPGGVITSMEAAALRFGLGAGAAIAGIADSADRGLSWLWGQLGCN